MKTEPTMTFVGLGVSPIKLTAKELRDRSKQYRDEKVLEVTVATSLLGSWWFWAIGLILFVVSCKNYHPLIFFHAFVLVRTERVVPRESESSEQEIPPENWWYCLERGRGSIKISRDLKKEVACKAYFLKELKVGKVRQEVNMGAVMAYIGSNEVPFRYQLLNRNCKMFSENVFNRFCTNRIEDLSSWDKLVVFGILLCLMGVLGYLGVYVFVHIFGHGIIPVGPTSAFGVGIVLFLITMFYQYYSK